MSDSTFNPADLLTGVAKGKNAQDVADMYGINGKEFRRYLREGGFRAGKGKNYRFTDEEAREHVRGFILNLNGKEATDEQLAKLAEYVASKGKK